MVSLPAFYVLVGIGAGVASLVELRVGFAALLGDLNALPIYDRDGGGDVLAGPLSPLREAW
jgi:hypothetical protein